MRETLVGSSAETVGFCGGIGHITDLENSLVYRRARYYDPSLGRFISQDPGCNGTNWYIYCGNSPVNMVDPRGRVCVSPDAIINWVADMSGWQMAALHLAAVGTALGLLGAYVGALATNMALANVYQSPFLTMRAGMMAEEAWLLTIAGVMCGLAGVVCGVLGELDDPDAAGYVADYLTTAGGLP